VVVQTYRKVVNKFNVNLYKRKSYIIIIMPQLVPFYFMNEVMFAFTIIVLIIYILSKYILPRVVRLFLSRIFINKI
jgi:F-type H+-transporting ATPase subunit 8